MRFRLGRLGCFKLNFILWIILAISIASFVIRSKWKSKEIPYIGTMVTENIGSLGEKPTVMSKSGCVQPELKIRDPVMMKFYKKMDPYKCEKKYHDLVYVTNGTLRFWKPLPADTSCSMYPLIRGVGDYKVSYGKPVTNVKDKQPLVSDFFKINCSDKNDKMVYDNLHLGVHVNKTLKDRVRSSGLRDAGLKLSVAMLGFDSMSRMSWLLRMPKTRDYLVNGLGAIELEGYNIMGDGTPAALFPMLTGKHEWELPEARRGFKDAKTVDDFPWIWKEFQQNGYVTSWADAEINMAPFNYRLLGFEHPPTDFFMRPFYLAADQWKKKYHNLCHGSLRKQQLWFNFFQNIFSMYRDDPKFLFHFFATLSHNDNNPITMADDDLNDYLHSLEDRGYLNNSLLVVFADHGNRYAGVRATLPGKFEERLPYFSLRFPPWFKAKYPELIRNLRTNTKRLTTAMDIHETLNDVLSNFENTGGPGNVSQRGISLFKEIPEERTCLHADIAPHWCACMPWKTIPVWNKNVERAVQASIDYINSLTEPHRGDCALLTVQSISSSYISEVGSSLLRFKESTGDRGIKPILTYNTKAEKSLYQLTFVAAPSQGLFEVTAEHDLVKDTFIIDKTAISRINKYGDAPKCILSKNREIRQFCYCNNILKV